VTLRVSETLLGTIHREGERAYPGECCGVLAGQPGEIKQVRRLLPVVNRRADDPHRYLIAPEDLQRVGRGSPGRPRGTRVLPLAPGSPGGTLVIRCRTCLALVQLSDRAGRPRTRGRGHELAVGR
jgi:hypothetical protein